MTRDEFRRSVFERDDYSCVLCGKLAQDAHHIMERRLFDDGGYHLDNGASVCGDCHVKCEQTLITTEELREKCGISKRDLPPHLYHDYIYDKWGNIINPDGTRIMGELYHDPSVQKILPEEIKALFSPYVKYPRTFHLPWSESLTSDDRKLESMEIFEGQEIVVTEKMDGENSTIYWDGYFHARSISGKAHPSQSYLKSSMQKWCYDLPQNWRVCGENLYACHSIEYQKLPSYFMVFSIWDERNECLSWKDTCDWAELLGLTVVPTLYEGIYNEALLRSLPLDKSRQEGYVLRLRRRFSYAEFRHSVAKFVRENHVQDTVHNWRLNWNPNNINKLR